MLDQVLLERLGGQREIVVRDLGEEQVVDDVAVGDVVVQRVNAKPKPARWWRWRGVTYPRVSTNGNGRGHAK